MLKMVISFYLSVVVFLSSIGFSINHHYCSKEDKHYYSFFNTDNSACEDEKKEAENHTDFKRPDCCKILEEINAKAQAGCCSDFTVKSQLKELLQIKQPTADLSPKLIELFWSTIIPDAQNLFTKSGLFPHFSEDSRLQLPQIQLPQLGIFRI